MRVTIWVCRVLRTTPGAGLNERLWLKIKMDGPFGKRDEEVPRTSLLSSGPNARCLNLTRLQVPTATAPLNVHRDASPLGSPDP